MSHSSPLWQALPSAEIDWKDDTPISRNFDDIYFNPGQGLAEARHVYLLGNDIPSRWSQSTCDRFVIGELGFGSGLNFCVTVQAWCAAPEPKPKLHFISVEGFPMKATDLDRALSHWPELNDIKHSLLARYPDAIPGTHRLAFLDGNITLDLWFGDVAWATTRWAEQDLRVDAWYLDGFAPSKNSSMWSDQVLDNIAHCSPKGCTASTFSVAGKVKTPLRERGFNIHKKTGFGRKREQLFAVKHRDSKHFKINATPWHKSSTASARPEHVAVIGAGLAGGFAAYALANRGIKVSVIDPEGIATQASGNSQGVVYCRIPKRHAPLGDFGVLAFRYATQLYRDLLSHKVLQEGVDASLCGMLHTFPRDTDSELALNIHKLPNLARIVDEHEARNISGLALSQPMLHFPESGWIAPKPLCQALLSHPNIELIKDGFESLASTDSGLHLKCNSHNVLADCVVFAAGTGTKDLITNTLLPTKAIRGQTTQIPAINTIKSALCNEGYIAPAVGGQHCIGATFDLDDADTSPRSSSDQENLAKLDAFLAIKDRQVLGHRVAFRCTTPDYLPIVGPVPNNDAMQDLYQSLQFDGKRIIPEACPMQPGIFVLTGLGSRGLTYGPLAGELLASLLNQEPLPLANELIRALSPARFGIRQLKKRS